jgi:hypothetical protein
LKQEINNLKLDDTGYHQREVCPHCHVSHCFSVSFGYSSRVHVRVATHTRIELVSHP